MAAELPTVVAPAHHPGSVAERRAVPDTRVLSFHADYGCRHRNRCCTPGWPIEVTDAEGTSIERAIREGALTPPAGAHPLITTSPPDAGETRLLRIHHDRCVFSDNAEGGGRRIHRALGHQALPLACRQFPRQVVSDPRGVSVTLSHYCPTAADHLATSVAPISIVANAAAFPGGAEYVGLEADPALPPLLHPAMAMDWDNWWRFEQLSVELMGTASAPLGRLALAVEHVRQWNVDDGPLSVRLTSAFAVARSAATVPNVLGTPPQVMATCQTAVGAVPTNWRDAATAALGVTPALPVSDHVWRRFVAAHIFENWTAHLGEGLRTWFASVHAAACLLAHTGAPGRADLILRHLADSNALVARWNPAEHRPWF